MGLTFAEDSWATMPAIVHPTNWERFFAAGWASTKQKVSGNTASPVWRAVDEPLSASSRALPSPPNLPRHDTLDRFFQVSVQGGKITAAYRPGRIIISHSDFLKPKEASGYLKKMWNLWLIFERWEWLTVQREVFFQENSTGPLPTVYKTL